MSEPDAYGELYAAQYARGSFETRLIGVRRGHVLRWLEHYEAERVLEVGCGLEPLFVHYGAFHTWRTVEPVPEFAARARELAVGNARVAVDEGYLEDRADALSSEAFDFIVVSGLLHEVPDQSRLLAALRTLCGAETVVHFNVPNMRSFHRLLAVEMGLIGDMSETSDMDRAFGHYGRFDRDHLNDVLRGAGFRVLESGSYFVKPFTHDQMDALLATNVFPSSLIEGLDRMTKYMPEHGCELYANARRA